MARQSKAKKSEDAASDGPPAGSYTLKRGRESQFRRTIRYESGVSAQLVFSPDQHIDLTQEEVDGLRKEIACGLIVPSNTDDKGRQRVVREVTTEAKATIESLQSQVDELAAENAQLKADMEAASKPE